MTRAPFWAYALLGALVLGTTASTPAAPDKAVAPAKAAGIDFADAQPIVVDRGAPPDFVTTILVRNDESIPVPVYFSLTLQTADGVSVAARAKPGKDSPEIVAPNDLKAIAVRIIPDGSPALRPPLTGYLALRAPAQATVGAVVKYRAIKVMPPLPSPLSDALFGGSFVVAALVALGAGLALARKGFSVRRRMGLPSWSFGDSWGSNIAVGGAILTQVLALLLPDQTRYLNKTAYSGLSLVFGILILAAPTLYSLARKPVVPPPTPPVYHGFVGVFIVASGVILWGALGQLATVAFVLMELSAARQLGALPACALVGVVGLLVIVLAWYGARTIYTVPQAQAVPETGGAGPLPRWSML